MNYLQCLILSSSALIMQLDAHVWPQLWRLRLSEVVFSGLRRAAGGLLARRRGLGAGRGGHQEPNRKIRSEVPLALALRATARNRCGPTGCLAACWLAARKRLNSGLAAPYTCMYTVRVGLPQTSVFLTLGPPKNVWGPCS